MVGQRAQRRDRESWAKTIARYERSGQSHDAFCEANGLNVGTFRAWLYRIRKGEPRPCPAFVEVVAGSVTARPRCVVRVGPTEIEFEPVPEPGYLAALLVELSEVES